MTTTRAPGATREEILTHLISIGADPEVAEVDKLHARIGGLAISGEDRIAAIGAAVEAAGAPQAPASMPHEESQKVEPPADWQPAFTKWRHGGWYVVNVQYLSGACGCVSNNYPDHKWRIVCDPRRGGELGGPDDFTFQTRDAAARAEYALASAVQSVPRANPDSEKGLRWFVGEMDHTWSWNEDGRMEEKCRVVVDLGSEKMVAAQVWGFQSWHDASADEMDDMAKSLFDENKMSADQGALDFFAIDRLPVWASGAAADQQLPPYQDEEVIGLDNDGCVVQWDGDNDMPVNSGESLDTFGLHNLREHELPRVGVAPEVWKAAVAKFDGTLQHARDAETDDIATGLRIRFADCSVQDAYVVWEGGYDVATCNEQDSATRVAKALRLAGSVENIWVTKGPELETVYNDSACQGELPSPNL